MLQHVADRKAVLYLACRRSPLSCGNEEQSRTGQLSVAVLVTEISQTALHVSIPTDRERDGEGVVVISKLDESEPRRYRAASTDSTCTIPLKFGLDCLRIWRSDQSIQR